MLLTLYLNISFPFELEFNQIIKSHRGKLNIGKQQEKTLGLNSFSDQNSANKKQIFTSTYLASFSSDLEICSFS